MSKDLAGMTLLPNSLIGVDAGGDLRCFPLPGPLQVPGWSNLTAAPNHGAAYTLTDNGDCHWLVATIASAAGSDTTVQFDVSQDGGTTWGTLASVTIKAGQTLGALDRSQFSPSSLKAGDKIVAGRTAGTAAATATAEIYGELDLAAFVRTILSPAVTGGSGSLFVWPRVTS